MGEPYVLTEEEKAGIGRIREEMGHGNIPPDLDTDLNLRRWHIGWKGSLENIVPRFRAYIDNRRAAGYDRPDFIETFDSIPAIRKYLHFYSISRFLEPVIDREENTVLLLQRTENVFHEQLINVCKTSDILQLYFAYCELSLRHILNQDWYCEFLHKSLVINPPTVINLFWQIGKLIMSENTLQKINVINKMDELKKELPTEAIPAAYGGTLRDESGWSVPEFCTNAPRVITEKDHYVPGTIWDEIGLNGRRRPEMKRDWVKPKQSLRFRHQVTQPNSKLAWQFNMNGDLEFSVYKCQPAGSCYLSLDQSTQAPHSINKFETLARQEKKRNICFTDSNENESKEERAIPGFVLTCIKLDEEGFIHCPEPAEYVFEFKNTSSLLFSIKVNYAIADNSIPSA